MDVDALFQTASELREMQQHGDDPALIAETISGSGFKPMQIANALRELKQSEPPEPNFVERVGRGATDVHAGVRQLLPERYGGFTPEQNEAALEERAVYDKAAGEGVDFGRMAGEMAAAAPTALVPGGQATKLIPRTAYGAGSGAATGAVLLAEDGGERAANAGAGFVGGGVGAAVLPAVARGAVKGAAAGKRAVQRGGQVLKRLSGSDTVQLDAALDAAANAAGASLDGMSEGVRNLARERIRRAQLHNADLEPEAVARLAEAETEGFAMTRGQARRDADEFYEEDALAERNALGAPLRQQAQGNKQLARDKMEAFAEEAAGPDHQRIGSTDRGASEARLAELAGERRGQLQAPVRASYEANKALANPALAIDASDLAAQVSGSRELASAVRRLPKVIKREVADFLKGKAALNYDQLVELDQALTSARPTKGSDGWRVTDKALKDVQGLLRTKLDRALVDAGAEPGALYSDSVRAAAEAAAEQGGRRTISSKLTDAVTKPGEVGRALASGSPQELTTLVNYLAPLGDEPMQIMRSLALNDILSTTMTRAGDGEFTAHGLRRAINRYGPERLDIIFGEGSAQRLLKLQNITSNLFEPPARGTVPKSATAPLLFNAMADMIGFGARSGSALEPNSIPVAIALQALRGASGASRDSRTQAYVNNAISAHPGISKAELDHTVSQMLSYLPGAASATGVASRGDAQ